MDINRARSGSALMKYYDAHGITLYLGDCRDILPSLDPASVDLLLTDPPYGVSERTDRKTRKRTALAQCNDFPAVVGDSEPFDPAHLLVYRRVILFGANHYAERLPASSCWLIWDKLDGLTSKRKIGFNDNGDAELAWSNLPGPIRLIRHRWMGMLKASEQRERRVHPTQKPIALMATIQDLFTSPDDLIVDPYAGSGSTLIAARRLGRRAIGMEIEERYCEATAERLTREDLEVAV